MKLKEGTHNKEYWNEHVGPFIGTQFTDVIDDFDKEFMVYGQTMGGIILDKETDKYYKVSAWMTGEVSIKEIFK